MNKSSLLTVSILATFPMSLSVSASDVEVSPYIVNGSSASVTEFPSIATLFYDRIDYDGVYGSGSFCGGTLLDEQHILTAAHCFYNDNGNTIDEDTVLFTSIVPQLSDEGDFPNGNIQKVMAETFYFHPDYNHATLLNDIAIIKLASPYNIDPNTDGIQRPADESYRGPNTFKALGHGRTTDTTNPIGALLETTLTYETNATCDSVFNTDIQDSHFMF
ncbi:S1 family peptidase [Vibrio mexicanus]|uniref:S1 family peptidase n=1 Tax=Vibrio mexicanus TaxID=1004326 RepID=UPI0012FB949A|nr:trypsin-like serine protease [Vibrio mexicanus]